MDNRLYVGKNGKNKDTVIVVKERNDGSSD